MSKIIKKTLIVVVCIIAILVLAHLSLNYLVPFVKNMHSGMY